MVFARTRCLSGTSTHQCTSTPVVYKSNTRDIRHDHHHTEDTLMEYTHTIHENYVYTKLQRTPKRPTTTIHTKDPRVGRYLARVVRPRASRHTTTTTTTTRAATNRSSARIFLRSFRRLPRLFAASRAVSVREIHSFIHRSVGRSVTRIDSIIDSFIDSFARVCASRSKRL